MLKLSRLSAWILIGSVVVCFGCDTAPPTDRSDAETAEDEAVTTSDAQLVLIPEGVRSNEPIAIGLTGVTGDYSVSWYVNDVPISAETDYQLPPNYYSRGDRVEAIVLAGDLELQQSTVVDNSPPEMTALEFTASPVQAGSDLQAVPTALDADDDFISYAYEWQINDEVVDNLDTDTLPGGLFKRGDRILVRITPSDDTDEGEAFFADEVIVPNGAPEIQSEPIQQIQNALFRYQVVAVDPDQDPLTYRLESAPKGMSIDANSGLIQWTVTPEDTGEYAVTVMVEDGEGGLAEQQFTLSLGYEAVEPQQEESEQ